jgi:hypothetical protein
VAGLVTTASSSIIAPGSASALGVLAMSGNVTLSGTNLMKLNKTVSPSNDVLNVAGTLTYGGTLKVSSLGGAFTAGDSFQLFTAASYAGSFSATNLPTGGGLTWSWNPANGTLTVVTGGVNSNPTNITATVSGNVLTLSWPADHTGWTLQAQTNSLGAGLNPNPGAWFAVTGSTTVNTVNVTMDPAKGTVFYRLVLP